MHTNPQGVMWSVSSPRLLSLLRIAAAFAFIQHGTAKLFAFPPTGPDAQMAPLLTLMWFAGIIETVGGIMMLLGLFARPVAFVLAGEMATAYFMAHAPQGFWLAGNQGELALLFCFIWLYVSAAGPGPWSLDSLRFTRRVERRLAELAPREVGLTAIR